MKHSIVCTTLAGATVALAVSARPVVAAAPPDSDITMWVKSSLRHDPHVDPAGIEVMTRNGVVTLNGAVRSLASRQRALDDVKRIDGVIGVVDKLGINTGWRPDADIAIDVRYRIVNNRVIETHGVGVTCKDATVTLYGTVGSWAELQESAIVAAEVRGVKSVENRLAVAFAGTRTDGEIGKDAEAKLDVDVYLTGLPVTVTVNDGVVTLAGTVGSQFEKDRADREIRYLSHVKDVTNQLRVSREENRGVRTTPKLPNDKTLAANVKAVLGRDVRLDTSKVEVKANAGHVTLTGTVPFGYQKHATEQDARDTVGTAWVTNELLVIGVQRDDAAIRSDVLVNFDSDYLLSGLGVEVHVKDGAVTLGGYVSNKAQQQHAEEVVTRVVGVKEVKNQIKIERDHFADDALTREVANRLSYDWFTAPVHDKIHVAVVDGAVTLTGEVNTWSERAEAARVALRTAGVWTVHNRLAVRGAAYPWEEQDDEIVIVSPYYWTWYPIAVR